MIEKEIIVRKTSCKGKKFEYTTTRLVYTEEEKQERYEQRLADAREETRQRRLAEEYENERSLHKAMMRDILESYDEFMRNVLDFN